MPSKVELVILSSLDCLEPHLVYMAYEQDESRLEVEDYKGYVCRRLSSCLLDRATEVLLEGSRESTHDVLLEKGETRQWTSWSGFQIDRMLARECLNRRT